MKNLKVNIFILFLSLLSHGCASGIGTSYHARPFPWYSVSDFFTKVGKYANIHQGDADYDKHTGRISYFTASFIYGRPGARPISKPLQHLSADQHVGRVRIRIYDEGAPTDGVILSAETVKAMASGINDALSIIMQQIPSGNLQNNDQFEYNISIIGNNRSAHISTKTNLKNNIFKFSYFFFIKAKEKPELGYAGHLAKTITHETYHILHAISREGAFGVSPKANIKLSRRQKSMLDEVAANLLGNCTQLAINHQINLSRRYFPTIRNANDPKEMRTGSLNDRLLKQLMKPSFKINTYEAQFVFGPMLFNTLWAEYAGTARTIKADSPAAKKFMNLCRYSIWPPQKLVPVLQKMAGDGVDPPELLRVQDMATAQEGP